MQSDYRTLLNKYGPGRVNKIAAVYNAFRINFAPNHFDNKLQKYDLKYAAPIRKIDDQETIKEYS